MNKAIFSSVLKMDGGGAGKHQKLKKILFSKKLVLNYTLKAYLLLNRRPILGKSKKTWYLMVSVSKIPYTDQYVFKP